ncbi:MAG: hypothetical protein NC110_06575 [Ruminococcus sp.]|nr:hypothetical protein [Ruminococcus sp.]
MIGYRIVSEDGKYYFELIPGNNSQQMVGYSKTYDSREECIEAVSNFRDFVAGNCINSLDSPFVRKQKKEKNRTAIQYIQNDEVVFESRAYEASAELGERVKMVHKQIYDYTKKEV